MFWAMDVKSSGLGSCAHYLPHFHLKRLTRGHMCDPLRNSEKSLRFGGPRYQNHPPSRKFRVQQGNLWSWTGGCSGVSGIGTWNPWLKGRSWASATGLWACTGMVGGYERVPSQCDYLCHYRLVCHVCGFVGLRPHECSAAIRPRKTESRTDHIMTSG